MAKHDSADIIRRTSVNIQAKLDYGFDEELTDGEWHSLRACLESQFLKEDFEPYFRYVKHYLVELKRGKSTRELMANSHKVFKEIRDGILQ